MDRAHWQQLSRERVKDAELLLGGGQWAGAYYLAGYAVECGLKSCVLAFVERNPDVIFLDRKYSEKCWTHDIGVLVALADLQSSRVADSLANPALEVNWGIVLTWSEKARYELIGEARARRLHEAVAHDPNGVLPWIRMRW
ncbi:hypothetical protein [Aquisphaera insulae]|uniref:hypothetical protein n=1 Tax=Aquisphaera insulae TaxID=2712864 RepID=UPI0013EAE018|nr:hypothetical protein [Aquisphaera insulae]